MSCWRLVGVVLLPGGERWKLMLIFPNVPSVNIQCQKCSQCHISTFVSFCAILYSLAMFPLFLHWNPSPNPEILYIHTIWHSLGLLNFVDFADFWPSLPWVTTRISPGTKWRCFAANSQFGSQFMI